MKVILALACLLFVSCAAVEGRLIQWPPENGNLLQVECKNGDRVGEVCCKGAYGNCEIGLCKIEDSNWAVTELACKE